MVIGYLRQDLSPNIEKRLTENHVQISDQKMFKTICGILLISISHISKINLLYYFPRNLYLRHGCSELLLSQIYSHNNLSQH